ncbi:MAG: hypothetical protein HY609_02345 [Deltaproteobacteria bacterium]|nr:hypothetical protein [Deltaproteobacteria bacterium]MBI4223748.1 hypothetical protein [Deltaproteobacteria bacterium]
MPNLFKKILFTCLMLGGIFLTLYGLGETLVYLIHGKEMALFPRYVTQRQYNDYLIRGNVAGARYRHKSPDGRWEFQINRRGFRGGVDYSYEKPPGVLRVLVLGDSFTVGYEVDQDETYAVVLERELKKRGIAAEVINAGVSGFSNAEELVFLEQEGVRYQPDVVVLGFYFNDLEDNIRTGLFKLLDGELIVNSKQYAPVTNVRDFLNSFAPYRWLSENSYLHNYLNAAATVWVKKWLEQKRREEIAGQTLGAAADDYPERLACLLVQRIRRTASQNNAFFILLEIPKVSHRQVFPSWPAQTCAPESVSDLYVDGLRLLKEEAAGGEWYRPRGHRHWTPVSHAAVGKYLASRIAERQGRHPASFAQKPQR